LGGAFFRKSRYDAEEVLRDDREGTFGEQLDQEAFENGYPGVLHE